MIHTTNDKLIIKALAFLNLLYPRHNMSDGTIEAYLRILSDLPAELVQVAANDLGSRNTFFPAAAELRTAVFELMSRKDGHPTAYEAWGETMEAMSTVGSWGNPTFSDPLIDRTIKSLGGWLVLCSGENMVADRARFIMSYEIFVSTELFRERTLPEVDSQLECIEAKSVSATIKKLASDLRIGNSHE